MLTIGTCAATLQCSLTALIWAEGDFRAAVLEYILVHWIFQLCGKGYCIYLIIHLAVATVSKYEYYACAVLFGI